jgi:hypothetical protein
MILKAATGVLPGGTEKASMNQENRLEALSYCPSWGIDI